MIRLGSSQLTTLVLGFVLASIIWLIVPSNDAVRQEIASAVSGGQAWYRVDQLSVDWNAATGELIVRELRESLRSARGAWRSSVVRAPDPAAPPGSLAAGGVVCFGTGTADYDPEKGAWLILPLDEYVSPGCQARLSRDGTLYFVITERDFVDLATGETWSMPRAVSGPFKVPPAFAE